MFRHQANLQGVAETFRIEIQLARKRIKLNGLSLSEFTVHADAAIARDVGATLRPINAQVEVLVGRLRMIHLR